MTQIESGLAIVAALLDSAVDEWASSSTHDGDDWSYIDAVKAERDFANSIIRRLPCTASTDTEDGQDQREDEPDRGRYCQR